MTKNINAYNRRLEKPWSAENRNSYIAEEAERHRVDSWEGRAGSQFAIVKSAETTDILNTFTDTKAPPGSFQYSVRAYIPKVMGYFSEPVAGSQKQLIEATCPEFIGPSETAPQPGEQAEVAFFDPKNTSQKFNNGKFLKVVAAGVFVDTRSKVVPCALIPAVKGPTASPVATPVPEIKNPAKKTGGSGGTAPGMIGLDGNPIPEQASTPPQTDSNRIAPVQLGYTVCDSNYSVSEFTTANEQVASARKSIASNKKFKPRFPSAPSYPYGSRFGQRPKATGEPGVEGHSGVDIKCPTGTPILSVLPGKVVGVNKSNDEQRGGLWVKVEHPKFGNICTFYGHLNNVLVSRGDTVDYGTQIGISGNTGRSTGPHLHFELRRNKTDNRSNKDPVKFLAMDLEVGISYADIPS